MKRFLLSLLVVLLLAGCNGVILNAEYSQLLDRTAALSAETARRAEAGGLSPAEMTTALSAQAKVWQQFKDAKDGRAGE